jgi:hypothetical protein
MNHRLISQAEKNANRQARHRRKHLNKLDRQREAYVQRALSVAAIEPTLVSPAQAFDIIYGTLKAAKTAARSLVVAQARLNLRPYTGPWTCATASLPKRCLRMGSRGQPAARTDFCAHYEAGLQATLNLRALGYLPADSEGMAFFEAAVLAQLLVGLRMPREFEREDYLLNLVRDGANPMFLAFHSRNMMPLLRVPLPRRIVQELEKHFCFSSSGGGVSCTWRR